MTTGTSFRSGTTTDAAPPPAGAYSQAIRAGDTLYISGQTPRSPDGRRRGDEPFTTQVELTLANVAAIAEAAGARLADAAFVTVYLRDPRTHAADFDAVYREAIGQPTVPPARAVVQSDLPHWDIEVTAVIPIPPDGVDHGF
jgi:2-iminobutanoate/2-iminopropanoate deaminase